MPNKGKTNEVKPSSSNPKEEPYLQYEKSINKHIPFLEPGVFKQTFVTYTNKLVKQGLKQPLRFKHMYKQYPPLDYEKTSDHLEGELRNKHEQVKSKKLRFTNIIFKMLGRDFTIQSVIYCIAYFSQVPVPIIIRYMLVWLETEYEDRDWKRNLGYYYAGAFSLCVILRLLFELYPLQLNAINYMKCQQISRVSNLN